MQDIKDLLMTVGVIRWSNSMWLSVGGSLSWDWYVGPILCGLVWEAALCPVALWRHSGRRSTWGSPGRSLLQTPSLVVIATSRFPVVVTNVNMSIYLFI